MMKPNVDFPNSNTCWLTWKMTWSLDRMNQTRTGKAYKLLIIVSVMYSQSYILDLKMRQKFDKILHIFQLLIFWKISLLIFDKWKAVVVRYRRLNIPLSSNSTKWRTQDPSTHSTSNTAYQDGSIIQIVVPCEVKFHLWDHPRNIV